MKKITKLNNGRLSRSWTYAKLALKTGKNLIFASESESPLKNNINEIVQQFHHMKGGAMKTGQFLSLYGKDFLPKEIHPILETLEGQSHFLDWPEIRKEIPLQWLHELEIDPVPLAAASIGQVHRAQNNSKFFAMKIQYPGIEKAIDSDISILKLILKSTKILPKNINFKEVFAEIKSMLRNEMNYTLEKENILLFQDLIKELPQFKIPLVNLDYSNERIITSELALGESIRSPKVKNLSQERRNELGKSLMDLYFREIFEWGIVQTDAHLGNYQIEIGDTTDQWILLDFGASKHIPKNFQQNYKNLIAACAFNDRPLYFDTVLKMGILKDTEHDDLLWDYCKVLGTPFKGGLYDWGKSNIPEVLLKLSPNILRKVHLDTPPAHSVFLDRKISGIFYIVKELEAVFDPRALLEKYVQNR